MLGFRLRSIQAIDVSYSMSLVFIRGYGFAAFRQHAAYVWCNQVVHIQDSNGRFFSAHHPNGSCRIEYVRLLITETGTEN